MTQVIKEQQLDDIIIGATFLGAGGGGSPKDGRRLLAELRNLDKAEVTFLDTEEMGDDERAVMVAEIGSPKAFMEAKSFPETVTAFTVMQDVAAQCGQRIKYLMAGELGGFNTMVPLYVAALKGVPFVDADGVGRAVPELATTLYAIHDVPFTPLIMAANNGDYMIAHLKDPADCAGAETIARYVSTAYGQLAAFSVWSVDRDTIQNKLVANSISLCMTIGRAFREASDMAQLSESLQETVEAKQLFVGRISKIEEKSRGGFDFGITYLDGIDQCTGQSASIGFKNENMLMRDSTGKALATVPDIFTLVDIDRLEPVTNADCRPGMEVAVLGATAPANWLKDPMGFDIWKDILGKFDYHGGYVPVN